ncbi:MAG: hypothetical protein KGQ49_01605 [Verrucomicrobia bacterium]|nr:hypothetical protein [Verrucomicrobiota bacterium]
MKGPLSTLLDLEAEAHASFRIERGGIQDSFRYRCKYLALRIAGLLLDEQGEINLGALAELTRLLEPGPYPLGPGREGDALIYAHIHRCLKHLIENKAVWLAIRRFSLPLCHKKAARVIQETLWPEPIRTLQTAHVRKAVLAAWLTLLRQTTGSCFATAPAILVQQTHPLQFFKDLYDLLSIGQMKRTMGGREFSVPLSFSSGSGDLQHLVSGPFFGLLVALESVGVHRLDPHFWESGPQTVSDCLRKILLAAESLTEEDLQDEEYLSRIQMTPLLAKQGAMHYQKPSARAQKVAAWKAKYEQACMTFKTITECSLLRSWEYSIASLADVKIDFARWNLYIGLGLHPDQKQGIGAFLYEWTQSRLQQCHEEIHRLAHEYERNANAVQAIEVMIQSTTSDARLHQLKSDWMSLTASLNTIVEIRDQQIAKAEGLTKFFAWLIERYDEKLQTFFQELFDPALIQDGAHIHDDSPAGFRLVYKHGRADASQWTTINNREEYIEALRDFFSRIETELDPPADVGKETLTAATTALIQFIQEDEFFNGALTRSKQHGRLSPWDYISGGTLQTLLMAYCNRDRPFTEAAVIPHSEAELLQFLASHPGQDPVLMHSPTHAFIFYPRMLGGRAHVAPFSSQPWDERMQEHLAHRISERLPEEERALFIHLLRNGDASASNGAFRAKVIASLSPRMKNKEALVDAALYDHARLWTADEAQTAIAQISQQLGQNIRIKLEGTFFGPMDVYNQIKAAILQASQSVFASVDWDQKIANAMRKIHFLPDVLLFGDSNWSGWFFGFVQNPTTGVLELWRFNRTATQGFPMHDWKEWVSPHNVSAWVLLSQPAEYETSLFRGK